MADTKDFPLKTAASAELDGVEVPAKHSPETFQLIDQAKTEVADWHPQWGAKPEKDHEAEETAHRLHEENAEMVKAFRAPNQHKLLDEKERVRNLMHIKDFCAKLHRILGPAADGGSRIFINTPPAIAGFDNKKMKGLFVKMRGMDNFLYHLDLMDSLGTGWKKICTIQNPYMSEWGVLLEDAHGGMMGWKYIGWRGQVLLRLILAGAITEEEANREFGVPQGVEVDREYRMILENWRRNGKRAN
jgi:hypothetical protein